MVTRAREEATRMERTQHFPPEVSNHSQSWHWRVRQPGSGKDCQQQWIWAATWTGCYAAHSLRTPYCQKSSGNITDQHYHWEAQRNRTAKVKGLKTAALSHLALVNPDRLRITTPTQPNSTPFAESHPTTANHVLELLLWTRRCSTGGKVQRQLKRIPWAWPGAFHVLEDAPYFFLPLLFPLLSFCLLKRRLHEAGIWLFFSLSCGPRTQNACSAHGKGSTNNCWTNSLHMCCVFNGNHTSATVLSGLFLLAPLGSAQISLSPRSSLEFTRFFC